MEGLCILLKKLAYPCRYTDMVPRYGRNPTELCVIFNTMFDFIYDYHNHRLRSWDQFFLQPNQLYSYAEAVHRLGAPLGDCFGFNNDNDNYNNNNNNNNLLHLYGAIYITL